jgi:hypothetical protein
MSKKASHSYFSIYYIFPGNYNWRVRMAYGIPLWTEGALKAFEVVCVAPIEILAWGEQKSEKVSLSLD